MANNEGSTLAQQDMPLDCVSQTSVHVNELWTNIPPIIKSVRGDRLAKYRFNCNIESVCYMPEGKQSEWGLEECQRACAVLLRVTFDLRDATIKDALIPTFVEHPINISGSFPDEPEEVKITETTVHCTKKLSPTVTVCNSVGLSVGEISYEEDKKSFALLKLYRRVNDSHKLGDTCGTELEWTFINKQSDYFPPSIKLLILATKIGSSPGPRFPFTLHIKASVKVKRDIFPLWPWLQTKDNYHGGTFDIWPDYCEDRAKKAFFDYRDARQGERKSKVVGLHPAVNGYIEEVQKLM